MSRTGGAINVMGLFSFRGPRTTLRLASGRDEGAAPFTFLDQHRQKGIHVTFDRKSAPGQARGVWRNLHGARRAHISAGMQTRRRLCAGVSAAPGRGAMMRRRLSGCAAKNAPVNRARADQLDLVFWQNGRHLSGGQCIGQGARAFGDAGIPEAPPGAGTVMGGVISPAGNRRP